MKSAIQSVLEDRAMRGAERFLNRWRHMTRVERVQYIYDHPLVLLAIKPESREKALDNLVASDFYPAKRQ